MGRQIVRQPDGKFAIWSSVVDDFVIVDCDGIPEIIDAIVEDAKRDITKAVHDVVGKLNRGEKPYYNHTKTFGKCMELIREVHGPEYEAVVLSEFAFSDAKKGDAGLDGVDSGEDGT